MGVFFVIYVTHRLSLRIHKKPCTINSEMKMKSVPKTFPAMIFALLIVGLASILLNSWMSSGSIDQKKGAGAFISAAVVPHHNIVAGQRAVFFKDLANAIGEQNYPETIILVSPNHYLAGHGKIQVTDKNWQLGEGSVNANSSVVTKLVRNGVAIKQTGSFESEHGIYNILDDIHQTFPKANLVPIILEDVPQEQLSSLHNSLQKSCNKCLMISSVDFSHYQPAALADLHDQKTIRDLQTLDTKDVLKNAEVDSGSSLALLTMWAKSHQTVQFNLQNHTNSDLLLNNPDIEGTSHILGWYQQGLQVEPEKFVSFVISKDLHVGEEDRTIWGTDIVINESAEDFMQLSPSIRQSIADGLIIAGKLTADRIEFFGLPVGDKQTQNASVKLLIGEEKKQALNKLYEPYSKFITTSSSGSYIKIPIDEKISFDNLSSSIIKSKIKLLINLNQ